MKTSNKIKYLAVSMFLVFLVLVAGKVYSQNFDVSDNVSGSNNSININQSESYTSNQKSSANINNDVEAGADTGGNWANDNVGGSNITTGDAGTNVEIKNEFNKNVGGVDCKDKKCPTPTPKPSPKAKASPTVTPTATLTPVPSGNGDGDGGNGGGVGGPDQAGEVLGLPSASGEKSLLHFLPGFLFVAFGFGLLRRNAER